MPPKHSIPAATLSSGPKTLKHNSSPFEIACFIWSEYTASTPQRTKLLDAFMVFLLMVGAIQFVYCILAGNFPFNAFLSGFCASVGQFVLTASLRMQTGPSSARIVGDEPESDAKKKTTQTDSGTAGSAGKRVSHERAFADYIFGSLILHFFCINFIN